MGISSLRRSRIPGGDLLTGAVGLAMLVAGPVMVVRGIAGRREIRAELAAQRITFPEAHAMPADLAAYAGRRLETGNEARAYARLIKSHLTQATSGRTYSEIGEELRAGEREHGRPDEKLADLHQTAFIGETLRGSLMSAYQAWQLTSLVTGLGGLFTALGAGVLATCTGRRATG